MSVVRIAGQDITVERPTVAKGSRVLTLVNLLQRQMPELTRELAVFRRDYARDFADELTRTEAMLRFPDRVLYDRDDNPLLKDGQPVTVPSPLSKIPEEQWERDGHMLRLPREPTSYELGLHMIPMLVERVEEPFMRLLGLMVLENDVVDRYVRSGDIWERVDETVDTVIRPAGLDEIAELLVVTFEVIDRDVIGKVRALGKRVAPLLRMLGMTSSSPTDQGMSSEPLVSPNTVSVSGSPGSSDGIPERSSGSPGTPSQPSATSSTASAV